MSFKEVGERFWQWLKDIGVEISPKIALHDYRSQGQGRGVIAVEDIAKGETLFTIPREAVMSVDNDSQFESLVAEKDFGPWINLIAYMMTIDQSANWKPYFDVLPTQFNTPMFWDETETGQLLKGSAVVDKIGKSEAEEQYKAALEPFFASNPQLAGEKSVESFHRMGSLIMSYSFDVFAKPENQDGKKTSNGEDSDDEEEEEEELSVKAMVPLADMLNAHTRLCNANLCHDDKNHKVLEMRAIKDIPKGEQVYNTYGELPNSDLLRRYGYAEAGGTEFDVVEVSTETMGRAIVDLKLSSSEKVKQAISQLESMADEDVLPFYDDAYDVPVSGEPDLTNLVVLSLLEVLATQDNSSLPSMKKLVKNAIRTAEEAQLTESARNIWTRAVELRLQDYQSDLVEEAKSDPNVSPKDDVIVEKNAMCREVLLGEIRILLRTAEWANGVDVIPVEKLLKDKRKGEESKESRKKSKKN